MCILFDTPLDSFVWLGILLGGQISTDSVALSTEDIIYKYFCILYQNKYILISIYLT